MPETLLRNRQRTVQDVLTSADIGTEVAAYSDAVENTSRFSMVLGEDVSAGMPVRISASTLLMANAGTLAEASVVGLATEGSTTGNDITVQADDIVSISDWTAVIGTANLTPNTTYYLDLTDGQLTSTLPSTNYVVKVGRSVTATTFKVSIRTIAKRN